MPVDPTGQLQLDTTADLLLMQGYSDLEVAEACAQVALRLVGAVNGPGAAAGWLASIADDARRDGAEAAVQTALTEFDATNLSQVARGKIVDALKELIAHNGESKLAADALMGAGLSYITTRDGLSGVLAYLRNTAAQIEEALARGSTAAN